MQSTAEHYLTEVRTIPNAVRMLVTLVCIRSNDVSVQGSGMGIYIL